MSHPYAHWPYMGHSKYQLDVNGILDSFYIWGESENTVDISCNADNGCDLFVGVPKEFAKKVIKCRNDHVLEMERLFEEERQRIINEGE